MLRTCHARQEPIVNNIEGNDGKDAGHSGITVAGGETVDCTASPAGALAVEFESYLERFDSSGRERENQHQRQYRHPQTHHQSTRSTSSQASSSSGFSSLSSSSQTGNNHTQSEHYHHHQASYPSYNYRKDPYRQRDRDDPEDYAVGDDSGRIPEMDSPGKTSEMSSSMCSTPSAVSANLPTSLASTTGRSFFTKSTHGFTRCTSPSPDSRSFVLDLTSCDDESDMSITPTPLAPAQTATMAGPADAKKVGPGLTIDLGEQRRRETKRSDEEDEVERSSPQHRKFPANAQIFRSCLSRTISSPAMEMAGAAMGSTTTTPIAPPRLYSTRSESETLSTRSHRASLGRPARVTFCEKLPPTFPTHPNYDYDRSPHPVVPRLSYRDVLELREMKVEMALVTKRQQGAAGLTDDALVGGAKPAPPQDSGLGLQMNREGRPNSPFSLFEDNESVENLPPSPSALTSSFPSSIKLVSRLHEMGEFRPPARERGMGLKVEQTFGLDRVASGDSLRDDFAKHLSGGNGEGSISSLRRKTSGEFAVEESDFQKELRKAREELEAIAVQEARLGMASQLGGAKSNKGEQHSVAMGSSGSSTPLGLGIIRPSPSLNSETMSHLRSSSSLSSVNGGNRSRKSSLASQQGGLEADASTDISIGGLPSERASFAPIHSSIKSGILQGDDGDEGSLLFPSKAPPPSSTRPTARSARTPAPPSQSKNNFRPPSPILAPFARSAPIRATTQRTETLGTAKSSQEGGSKGSIFRPPSPILAPFARSSPLQH